ncbi:MAG: glycosyltransferase family 2 protein [Oligosphaeraceae bacterium]
MPAPQAPTISIIVPCYNCASFIRQALESVAGQILADATLETIVVDDASSDPSAAIVSEFLSSHPGFRGTLIRQPANAGVAVARNTGIHAAQGEFLMFLDADDALAPDCCQRLLELQRQTRADIAACNALHLLPGGRRTVFYPQAKGRHLFPGDTLPRQPRCHPLCETCWGKLYRREWVVSQRLLFRPGLGFGQDTLFDYVAVLSAHAFAVDFDYCGYLYRDNQASCVNTAKLQKRLVSLEQVLTGLRDALGTGCNPLLLRKSCEYLWTLRKFGRGRERRERLQTLLASPLWHDIILPNIMIGGKPKHRLCAWLLRHRCLLAIHFW